MIERSVFVFHVLEGEASVRLKDGRLIRVRQGDSGIIPPGDAGAHTVRLAPGERVVIVGFGQAWVRWSGGQRKARHPKEQRASARVGLARGATSDGPHPCRQPCQHARE